MKKKLLTLLLTLCLLPGALAGTAAAKEYTPPVFSTLDEVRAYIYNMTFMLNNKIEFSCTDALFEKLTTDNVKELMYNYHSINRKVRRDEKTNTISISNIEYYQGFKIAQAWEICMEEELLDDEELATLRIAQGIVDKVCAGKNIGSEYGLDLDVLIALHDELCRRVTYELGGEGDGWQRQDTAVGALLYGGAECDGYADAFYLLVTLLNCGASVGKQHGKGGDGWHAWNLVGYKGQMYHVDVCWDDFDDEEKPEARTYAYFMVGSELFENHTWKEEFSAFSNISAYNNWDACYYTRDRSGMTFGAYYGTVKDAADYAAYVKKKGSTQIHVMVDGAHTFEELRQALRNNSAWKWGYTAWTRKMGDYTCYTIVPK